MGILQSLDRKFRGDRVQVVDILSVIRGGDLSDAMRASMPVCLDEVIDWTDSANSMSKDAALKRLVRAEFKPLVRKIVVKEHFRHLDSVNEKHLDERQTVDDVHIFLSSCVLILAEPPESVGKDENRIRRILSLPNFCLFLSLLRRCQELKQVEQKMRGDAESEAACPESECLCHICSSNLEDVVLPCLHGVCSECERKWIDAHGICPFCRRQFEPRGERVKDQWTLEDMSLTNDSLQADVEAIENRIRSFWYDKGEFVAITKEDWSPIHRTVTCSDGEEGDYAVVS